MVRRKGTPIIRGKNMTQEFDPQKDMNDWTIKEIEDFIKLPITETRKNYDDCKHLGVLLDDENKAITCKNCGKVLDPFWYLQLLAKEWSSRRYQDFQTIKAYRALQQQELNARARGNVYVRPNEGNGMQCWDSYEALHGHPPEYVYYRGAWYAGEDDGCEHFDYIKQQLALGKSRYRAMKKSFLEQFKKTNNISDYVAKTIYTEGFRNGREYERYGETKYT